MGRRMVFVIPRWYGFLLLFFMLLVWTLYAEYRPQTLIPVTAPKPIYQGSVMEKNVALAINVDWGEECIPPILELLQEQEVAVTFFVTGYWAERHPLLLKDIVDQGHELGNHGFRHVDPVQLSDRDLRELITKNKQLLMECCGYETDLFAPPYGAVNDRIARIAHEEGHRTVMWTVDTIDWQRPSPELIISRVIGKVEAGAIILAHPTAPTLQALPFILAEVQRLGYDFCTVGTIIEETRGNTHEEHTNNEEG